MLDDRFWSGWQGLGVYILSVVRISSDLRHSWTALATELELRQVNLDLFGGDKCRFIIYDNNKIYLSEISHFRGVGNISIRSQPITPIDRSRSEKWASI